MGKLLGKEMKLSLHPASPIFLLLSALLIIPNYPYYVTFFYTGLAIFMTCLLGRENKDVEFTMMLPIPKKDIVKGRYVHCIILELAQLVLCIPFAIIRQGFDMPGNQVGMDANIALFGFSLIMFALFNLAFFAVYYKNVKRVGVAFVVGSTVDFLFIVVVEAMDHIVPLFRDKLDTSDPQFLGLKLGVLACGIIVFVICTAISYKTSVKNFEQQDI